MQQCRQLLGIKLQEHQAHPVRADPRYHGVEAVYLCRALVAHGKYQLGAGVGSQHGGDMHECAAAAQIV
jgi:hypothetical protein